MADERQLLSELLPGYQLGEEIGRGGWGVVFEAEHRTLERRVAVKHLPGTFGSDPSARDRFRSEARVVASLDHPHIVPLFDFVEREDMCVFVMELMPGGTLWDRFSDEGTGLAPDAACAVTLAVLGALHHAHEHGVLHRDVKPENVLFSTAGRPKLADFGIAKVLGDGSGTRTATGTIMGTPAYMAPEQGSGEPVSPATDVYAVGVMLYELLSGRLPFESTGNPLSQLYRHVYEAPTPLEQVAPSVAPSLSAVVMRALGKAPADRHESAASFVAALDSAATAAFGGDWVARSGVPILGTRAVLDQTGGNRLGAPAPPATGRAASPAAPPSSPTASSPPPSAPPAPSSPPPSSPAPQVPPAPPAQGAPPGPPPSAPPVAPPGVPAAPSASEASAFPEPSPPTSGSGSGGTRRLLVGAVGIVVLIAVAVAAMALRGDDTPREETADPPETLEPAFDSAGARARLETACAEAEVVGEDGVARRIPEEVCGCAVDAAWNELTEDQLRANDVLLQETGTELTAEVVALFDRCRDELG